jgi:RNA polymerase sigma factor (sigma-70 family)
MASSQVACAAYPSEIVHTVGNQFDRFTENQPTPEEPVQAATKQEKTLVQRCLDGDEQAWAELLHTHRRPIYSIAARFGAKPHDCADIYQQVCIELFNGLGRVLNEQSLRSWVITVTVRQAFRWRKSCSQHMPLDEMEIEPGYTFDLSESMWEVQRKKIVRKGMEQLPPRSAEMLRLLFFEQPPLPYHEVARRLGLATGSIGFIRGRALRKLRAILDEAGFNGS